MWLSYLIGYSAFLKNWGRGSFPFYKYWFFSLLMELKLTVWSFLKTTLAHRATTYNSIFAQTSSAILSCHWVEGVQYSWVAKRAQYFIWVYFCGRFTLEKYWQESWISWQWSIDTLYLKSNREDYAHQIKNDVEAWSLNLKYR